MSRDYSDEEIRKAARWFYDFRESLEGKESVFLTFICGWFSICEREARGILRKCIRLGYVKRELRDDGMYICLQAKLWGEG